MYFVKTPWYLKSVYPSLIWDLKKEKTLYLTFDDGPVPDVTNVVLKILEDHQVHATFFLIGNNIEKNKGVYEKLLEKNHAVGNHTFHHLNGWKTENEVYYADTKKCDDILQSKLFRPPYGRISYNQIQHLKREYSIYMWDVLSGDFDSTLDAAQCAKNVIDNATDGSIIVFHDSMKAKDRVLQSLPVVLKYFLEKGFTFEKVVPVNF